MSSLLLTLLLATVAAGADLREQPAAAKALEPAITTVIDRFNTDEERLRKDPRVEAAGPAKEPSVLRATYRHAGGSHQILSTEPGANPVVTVRVRAVEFEKRAVDVNSDNLRTQFAKAPWLETPRGYLLDFRLRWTGSEWEQVGDPTAYPTLGVVGQP